MSNLSKLMKEGAEALAVEAREAEARRLRDKAIQEEREKTQIEAETRPLVAALSALKGESITAKVLEDVSTGLEEIRYWEREKILLINREFAEFFRITVVESEPSTDPEMWGFINVTRDDEICIDGEWIEFKKFLAIATKALEISVG